MKPLTASLNVKVTNEVSPRRSAVSATTMATVGRRVSTVTNSVSPTTFTTPVPSAKAPAATLISARPSKAASGVNVAENAVPLPEKLVSVPPVTLTSPTWKVVLALLRVKVTRAVLDALTDVGSLRTVTVGTSLRQLAGHASPATVLPSSQTSAPSRTPLPQVLAASQRSGVSVSSHRPLAHERSPMAPAALLAQAPPVSIRHRALQPSPAAGLLSSQPSPGWMVPLPHVTLWGSTL